MVIYAKRNDVKRHDWDLAKHSNRLKNTDGRI